MSTAEEYEKMSPAEKKKEDWMNSKWRPMMGWMYMCVCVFDFILAPILWAVIQFWETQAANDAFRQWQPLTLQGAGLFHMAMGAVLGLAAWGRTQEKMAGANNGGLGSNVSSVSSGPSFGAPSTAGFGSPATSFGGSNITNIQGSTVSSSFGAPPRTAGGFSGNRAAIDFSGGKRADYTDEEADNLPPARG
jgi:hypothetical protein